MLYMKEKTPDRTSHIMVLGLRRHTPARISKSVMSVLLKTVTHSPGTGFLRTQAMGVRKTVAGIAM